ncbi:cytochrome oxidase [Candidatus Methylacidiphilum fumarolicum]|uniref:Cbb3-type cytochrome oxidase, cytochrome c subunit n=2 Tax=Candidatus Methylacidiphilum fumarolicum TaxID=591154 RepID=I0JZ52_METFB|nr:cbb3-type cytochrome c oxidase subunit II [Candidatus Methylacidiphilum fumarolicum]MBW6414677.1 cbb3-type cytochrome c oxidase subunit II [Candidatus Methylacidiphilum fumarolicum]TFE70185.1 cytochrome oxidase [Candidatus Methylacidiphilum fumarolicum]TFE74249.1 cytochrome oxidase [Candidatus Methylacidiphilum fumarolicum]TFE75748.1 cytochrome oxidase [Candidatus Methylacidiphilum fumarolicum]TFE75906.1 cytochrome oxidase [Candidatus Methylacidiphilum fumarolicum]
MIARIVWVLGIFLCFLLGWFVYIIIPSQVLDPSPEGEETPPPNFGLVEVGQQVYGANGCSGCHTQIIRPANMGSDIARGWGNRRTFPVDYYHETNPFLGIVRIGPDLSNIGKRKKDSSWFYILLYEPNQIFPGTIMPPYKYLFRKVRAEGKRNPEALPPELDRTLPNGMQIMPSPEAVALVAYLLSLDRSYPTQPKKQ